MRELIKKRGGGEDRDALVRSKTQQLIIARNDVIRGTTDGAGKHVIAIGISLDDRRSLGRDDEFCECAKPSVDLVQLRIGQSMEFKQAWIARHLSILDQRRLGDDQLEGALLPEINDARDATMRCQVPADDDRC